MVLIMVVEVAGKRSKRRSRVLFGIMRERGVDGVVRWCLVGVAKKIKKKD